MAQPLRARFTAKNKELNGPQRGRQRLGGTPGDREDSGKRKGGVAHQSDAEGVGGAELRKGKIWLNTDEKMRINSRCKS